MKNLIELLTPRQDCTDLDAALERFANRYSRIIENGYVVSIPDNPMGHPHFKAAEVISELGLPVIPEQLMIHVNTFHNRQDLDETLGQLAGMGVNTLLAVTGDGSERLAKLKPEDIGHAGQSVTSVELLSYIHREHPGKFQCGVAYNPYEPQDHEMEKMRKKVKAGAAFIITQPILHVNGYLDDLREFNLPTYLDAWMSKKLHLLSQCVGYEIPEDAHYDPIANLKHLREYYPHTGFYLALLNMKTQMDDVRAILA